MKLINEAEIFDTWAPIIEQKAGITDPGKQAWLSKYCHYHSLNESAGAYQSLNVVNGMGPVTPPAFPAATQAGSVGGYGPNQGFYSQSWQGSGDKFPSLLPLAIQVAAKTVGFDIVPVIPMSGPSGVLSYLDYVYAGGKVSPNSVGTTAADALAAAPAMIKVQITSYAAGYPASFAVGTVYYFTQASSATAYITTKFVGLSRIDGYPIFEITAITASESVAAVLDGNATKVGTSINGSQVGTTTASASLVKALEDHIQGFSGAGFYDNNNWQGPFVDGTKTYNPMLRSVGEEN